MNMYWWALVIFVTALVTFLGIAALTSEPRVPQLADPAPLPGELPTAGRFDADWWPDPGPFDLPRTLAALGEICDQCGHEPGWCRCPCCQAHARYGPFPVDTGPLLHLSETTAANVELDRWTQARIAETDWLCAEAEEKIPPRWR